VPEAALCTELDRLLRSAQASQRMPSVSASVFRDGEVIWTSAIGVADVATARAATGADVYRIGSITKTFTAVLVMQLVEEGRIDLEAPLRTYLPEAPAGPTIRMALSHLTGVQREPPGEIWESMRPPTRDELLGCLEEAELVLPPGEQWHYSNLVFALLGEIVMRVRGEPYADALQGRILDPLGLARTSLRPTGPKASPYFVDPYTDTVRDEPDPDVTESTGAAGWLWSNAEDLARWGRFLADGDDGVLPKAVLDRMARVQAMVDEERWSVGWGLGLELYRRGDRVLVGHGGAMPGFLAGLAVHRGERTGAAVLTNTGAEAGPEALAIDLAMTALDALPRTPPPWAPAGAAPPELDGVLGAWWTEGEQIVLSLRGGRFRAELIGGPEGRSVSWFRPDGVDRWRVEGGRERGELLRAVRDDQGSVAKLYFATYPLTRTPSTFARED
jgi:CubicO group peptidase (beta-lactamase class C family)